jgi:diaminopimelate epimerase
MQLHKYNANGNDFIIFHSFIKKDRSTLAIELCDRHKGLGADGLIVLIPHKDYDFEWEFYNADGSLANMCGNGSRVAAHYAYSQGLTKHNEMKFLTGAGDIRASVYNNIVETELTPPIIHKKNIVRFDKDWWLVDTGVPHLITFLNDINNFDIQEARELRNEFNANVNIAKITDNGNIEIRTYERGVEGETMACGTGMASAFYRAYKETKIKNNIEVYPKSNETLYLRMENETIFFKGNVKKIYETNIISS